MPEKTFALFVPWMVMGGADRCGVDLLRLFKRRGYQTITISTRTNPQGNTREDVFRKESTAVYDVSSDYKDGKGVEAVQHILGNHKPDIIVVNNSHEGYRCLPMMRATCPGAQITALTHMLLPPPWDFENILRKHIAVVDKVLTVSHRLAREHVDAGIPEEKVYPLHWFGFEQAYEVAKPRVDAVRKACGISGFTKMILCPFRLADQKRPLFLVNIAKALLEKRKRFKFVVVGSGPDMGDLKKSIAKEKLEEHFCFTGDREFEEMPPFFAAADALCCPSVDEGIPLTYYEALQVGLPLAVSDVGGVSELVPEPWRIPFKARGEAAKYAALLNRHFEGKTGKLWPSIDQLMKKEFSYEVFKNRAIRLLGGQVFTGPPRRPGKIFVIGDQKAGGAAVRKALETLGLHVYSGDRAIEAFYQHDYMPPVHETIGAYDVLAGPPFDKGDAFKMLYEKHPDALFIHTVCDAKQWLKGKPAAYEPEWHHYYHWRNARIAEFFSSKNQPGQIVRLMTLNVTHEKNPWDRLCNFIGVTKPGKLPKFPRT